MFEPKDPRTQEIYRTLMQWMANRALGGNAAVSPNGNTLVIPVKAASPAPDGGIEADLSVPVKMFQLRFRKVTIMGGQCYAQCLDNEAITILYDPHWEDFDNIDRLLAAGDR